MKSISLSLVILILLCHVGYAQPYKSMFGTESSEWRVRVEAFETGPWFHNNRYEKDTQVNSIIYKKVSYGGRGYGLFREDLVLGKVWHIPPCETTEQLYMDYSVKKGDVFNFIIQGGSTEQKTVDSVYYIEDRKYIRCKYALGDEQIIFIEGIGCIWGMASHYNNYCASPSWENKMMCVYQNGILIYTSNADGNLCSPFTTSVDKQIKSAISIHPNPATDKLYISGVEQIRSMQITDIQGRLLKHFAKPEKDIDVSILASGMYLLLLQTDEGVYTHKFVKE